MHMAHSKILTIPELVQRIAYSLDDKTIVACTLVNKTWNSVWLPILWCNIDAGRQWRDPEFLSALHKHADLIRRLECGRYDDIRLLFKASTSNSPTPDHTQRSDVKAAIEPVGAKEQVSCINLIKLVLPKTTLANQADHARLLRLNPHLLDLSLTFHDDLSSNYTDLIDAIGELPLLRRIAFDENKTLEYHTLEKVLSCRNSTLEELSLKNTFFAKHPFGSGQEFAASTSIGTTELKESFGIQSLNLDGVACSQEFILCLTSRFPSLTHLSIGDEAEVHIKDDFGEKLAPLCPRLNSIDISSLGNIDDESIAHLIRALPNLRTFRAAETTFGDKSLHAVVDASRDLSAFDINATYVTDSGAIQRLLEQSNELTELNAWELTANVPEMMSEAYGTRVIIRSQGADAGDEREGSITYSGNSTPIRAQTPTIEQLSGETNRGIWGCQGLKKLIIGVDYNAEELTEKERALYPPSKARQFVYEQLSRLTKLEYLAIGGSIFGDEDEENTQEDEEDEENVGDDQENVEDQDSIGDNGTDDDDDEDWTPSNKKSSVDKLTRKMEKLEVIDQDSNSLWIDFSLRSGLAILEPLKQLRTLSIGQGDHNIGLREVEWMCKNWPRLRSIEGLYEDDAEEAVAWLRKHRPDIELEDDE